MKKKINVLFVDDDVKRNRWTVKYLKEIMDYRVEFIQTPTETIKIINERVFDMILLDMMMPEDESIAGRTTDGLGLDSGLVLLEEIRDSKFNQDCPVIVLSAREDLDELLKNAKVDFIQKPADPAEIADLIEKKLH